MKKLSQRIISILKQIVSYVLYYCGITGLILSVCLKTKPTKLILMYHRINDSNNELFSGVTLSNFNKQISVLKKYFRFVTLSELIALKGNNQPLAVITFDDGYKNTYTKAYPVLKENKISATVFLTTEPIDSGDIIWTDKLNWLQKRGGSLSEETRKNLKRLPNSTKNLELNNLLSQSGISFDSLSDTEKMLSWDEISQMNDGGIEFGSHTVNHPILTKVSIEEAEKEIVESKGKIESVIGKPITTFCYPNGVIGDFNEATKFILKENNFECAVTALEGRVEKNDDNFTLKRISLANRHPALAILKIIKEIFKK